MGGRELVHVLAPPHPNMKILYMSGYPDNAISEEEISSSRLAFIPKPFAPDTLAQKVHEVLDQSDGRRSSAVRHDGSGNRPFSCTCDGQTGPYPHLELRQALVRRLSVLVPAILA